MHSVESPGHAVVCSVELQPRCFSLKLVHLSRTQPSVELCALGSGQFIVSTSVDGIDVKILYDTGASICFVRPDFFLLKSATKCSAANCESGGLSICLGDDSKVSTVGCKHLQFSVKGQKHDYDYHVMTLPHGIDIIVGMDYMLENDVILITRQQTVMFGGQLCCYGKPVTSIDDKPSGMTLPRVGHVSSAAAASVQSRRSVIPASSMAPHTVQPVSEPESRDSNVGIVKGVGSDSTGTQSSNESVPAPVPMEVESYL